MVVKHVYMPTANAASVTLLLDTEVKKVVGVDESKARVSVRWMESR